MDMNLDIYQYHSTIWGCYLLNLAFSVTGVYSQQAGDTDRTVVYIVIGVVCGLVVLAVVALVCCLCCRPRNRKQDAAHKTEVRKHIRKDNVRVDYPKVVSSRQNGNVVTHNGVHSHSGSGSSSRPSSKKKQENIAARSNPRPPPSLESRSVSTTLPPETIKSRDTLTTTDEGVARGFSNMTDHRIDPQYVAKVFSHYPHHVSSLPRINEHGEVRATSHPDMRGTNKTTDSGYGGSYNAPVTSFSDWNISGKTGRPVERSHSHVVRVEGDRPHVKRDHKSPQRATSFQVKSSAENKNNLRYYKPAIIKEVDTPIHYAEVVHQPRLPPKQGRPRPVSDNMRINEPYLHYLQLQSPKTGPSKVVKRSVSDASEMRLRQRSIDGDPNALYAKPDKLKRKSAEMKRSHESLDTPAPPVPPPLKKDKEFYYGVDNKAFERNESDIKHKVKAEAVVHVNEKSNKQRRKSQKHNIEEKSHAPAASNVSYSTKGTKDNAVDEAFKFLDDFEDTTSVEDQLDKPRR